MPDDFRTGRKRPLQYLKDYVGSGADDESIRYKQQMAALEAADNKRHEAFYGWHKLREITANQSRMYRGYLIAPTGGPATTATIAEWLRVNQRTAGSIMRLLERVGLFERVAVPVFDPGINDPPDQDPENSGDEESDFRNVPENSGNRRKPFQESKSKSNSGIGNKRKNKFELEGDSAKATTAQGSGAKKTSAAPSASPVRDPRKPMGTDAGGGGSGIRQAAPASNIKLGERLNELYDSFGFAKAVYQRLGLDCSPNSRQYAAELGSFASVWDAVIQAGLGPRKIAEMYDKCMKESLKLCQKFQNGTQMNRSAVFNSNLQKRLNAAKAAAMNASQNVNNHRKVL